MTTMNLLSHMAAEYDEKHGGTTGSNGVGRQPSRTKRRISSILDAIAAGHSKTMPVWITPSDSHAKHVCPAARHQPQLQVLFFRPQPWPAPPI